MPRDLSALANEQTMAGMPGLSKINKICEADRQPPMDATDGDTTEGEDTDASQGRSARDQLHPYCQTLSLSDVDSCTRLEEACFPPHERATRAKIEYRLRNCGELCMGIFTSLEHDQDSHTPTVETSNPVFSGSPKRRAVLLGHIIATKSTNFNVTDDDMTIPTPDNPDPKLGHKDDGSTICVHSLAVLPQYQRRGLATTLMKAYMDRMESHSMGEAIALIAHDHLIPYYEKLGFENRGPSQAQFGGGGWFDMVKDIDEYLDDD